MHACSRLLSMVILIILVYPGATGGQSKGRIKIASQSPLSGGQAVLGEGIKLGAQLAVDNLKGKLEKMGYKVDFVPFDDQAKPDVGLANAKNIITDKDIIGVVGHLGSGMTISSSEVYEQVHLAMITPASTSPAVTDRGLKNVFRVCGREDVESLVGIAFAERTLRVRRVYVVHDGTTYGQMAAQALKTEAEKKGVNVLGVARTSGDLNALVTQLQNRNPDLLYFVGDPEHAGQLFKRARESGFKAKLMGSQMDSPDVVRVAGSAVVGMYYTTIAAAPTEYPAAKLFIGEYRKRFGKDPETFAAEAYDATAVLIKAIEGEAERGRLLARDSVTSAIAKVRYSGVTGFIEFDTKGDRTTAQYAVHEVVSADPAKWGKGPILLVQGPGTPSCPSGQQWCKNLNKCAEKC
jgi:branched-chain amino acid transport system substrate-binding protein